MNHLQQMVYSVIVPIYLDHGSPYSIVQVSLVESLGYIPSRPDEPINLTPIHGKTLQVKDCVVLPVKIEGSIFLIMEICASDILLGLYVLVQLESKTDYANQKLSVVSDQFCTQLYTKDDLINNLDGENDDPAFKLIEATLVDYFHKTPLPTSEEEKLTLVSLY